MFNFVAITIAKATEDIKAGSFAKFGEVSPYNTGSEESATLIDNVVSFLSNLIGLFTVLAALFFIVYTFTAAFNWMTAGGDSGKIEKARERLIQGVLGLILIVAAYGIIELVGVIIGIKILNPGDLINEIVPTN